MKPLRAVFVSLYLLCTTVMTLFVEIASRRPDLARGLILAGMPVLGLMTGIAAFIVRRYFEISMHGSDRDR